MSRDVPRDPISGQRAVHEGDHRDVSDMSSREIEQEIIHTRAHMSSTLNAIEARISPARLKHEVQSTIQDTVDQFNPQRIAKRAGDNMLETIKEHPMPALIAGLSIGYMFMKGSDGHSRERRNDDRYYRTLPYSAARGQSMYRDDVYPSRHPEYPARYRDEEGSRIDEMRGRAEDTASDVRERAGEAVSEARHRASDTMHDVQDRAGEVMSEARSRARHMGRTARRSARRAEHRVEDFVDDNPLLAGLVAAGAGALLGSLLPSTRFEDERMGPVRDDLMHQASDMADEARERARHVAEDAKEELKESGERIADSARAEAREMQSAHSGQRDQGVASPGETRRPEPGQTL